MGWGRAVKVQESSALGWADSSWWASRDHPPHTQGNPKDLPVAREGPVHRLQPSCPLSFWLLGPADLGAHPLGWNALVPRTPGASTEDLSLNKGM